jgi:hypothetical protein
MMLREEVDIVDDLSDNLSEDEFSEDEFSDDEIRTMKSWTSSRAMKA